MTDEPVIVARIARAHGIHGALILDPETDRPEAIFREGRQLMVVDGPPGAPASIRLAEARPHGGRWLVTVEGIGDRTQAERLRGGDLAVPRSDLPGLEDGGYLLQDLLGAALVEAGETLGTVRDVYDLPAGPMLSVDVEGRERLVPFDPGLVLSVDLEAGAIHVELPEGLLDI